MYSIITHNNYIPFRFKILPSSDRPFMKFLVIVKLCSVCGCLGCGPVLGGRSRGVGQSRTAETQDETPGGMFKDLSWTLFCGEYPNLNIIWFLMQMKVFTFIVIAIPDCAIHL